MTRKRVLISHVVCFEVVRDFLSVPEPHASTQSMETLPVKRDDCCADLMIRLKTEKTFDFSMFNNGWA